jgi:hypothetical protein
MSVRRTRMNESQKKNEAQIDRRIEFLINEAQLGATRDQVITYAFRVITNYLSVKCDARSGKLRRECHYRSKKAHALYLEYLKRSDLKGWLDRVTNEHQYPIKDAWEWMIKERANLSVQSVKDRLIRWPVVVVTEDENKELREVDKELRKVAPAIQPDQRYLKAKIKVLEETKPGQWRLRKSPNQISD